jgi:hypothetical protein
VFEALGLSKISSSKVSQEFNVNNIETTAIER